jgi:hypothetical protein
MTTTALRATPGRVVALALGVPIMLASVVWSAFTLVGALGRTSAHFHTSYAWSGGSVSLNLNDGNVQIRAAETRTVDVEYTEHYEFKRPTVKGVSSSSGVALTWHCVGGVFGQNCQINYVISVPKQAALQLRIGDGNLTLQGITAPVVAHTGDGSIHGSGLGSTTVQATVGDGSVHLEWVAGPSRVTAHVGDGSISLVVPRGSGPYAIARSGSGSANIAVATDPAAASKLDLDVGDGSIHVGYPG